MNRTLTKTVYGIPLSCVLAAFILALSINLIIDLGYFRVDEDEVFTGYIQSDQHSYFTNGREVVERGNGIFHSNPYSHRYDSPVIFTHFFFLLLGWWWKLTSIPNIITWQVLRGVLGNLINEFFGGQ